MKRYKIRAGTPEDIKFFHGETPPYATKSWVGEYDGKVVAIAGVEYQPYNLVVFSDIIDIENIPKITIWRGTLEIFEKIKELNKPLVAVCTGKFLNSGPYLERLGFNYCGNSEQGEIYSWRR